MADTPSRLLVRSGPDLIDFRTSARTGFVRSVNLQLRDPDSGTIYQVRAYVVYFNYRPSVDLIDHALLNLTEESLTRHPELAEWERFCIYDYHWPTGVCQNDHEIIHHHS